MTDAAVNGGSDVDADVIVVGCGPVGVVTALRCAQRGLSVLALDRSVEIYPLPRAVALDDEAQALFERAGVLGAIDAHTTPLPGGEFVDADGVRIVGIELPPGTVGALGHPPVVAFHQPGLEAELRAAAVDAGVRFEFGARVVRVSGAEQGAASVGLADGTTHTARWIVAADGAKSTVRELVGVGMTDQGFDQTWLVIDTTQLDDDLVLPRIVRQVCSPDRMTTFVPGCGRHRRWEFRLRPEETRDDMLDPRTIDRLLAPWAGVGQVRLDRSAVYRFHARVAQTFRVGRIFLAGDAAHQMPPFNGQGMCAGLRDAEMLAWLLADATNGRGDDSILDAYDAERRPHAAEQVAHSVDSGRLMQAIADHGEAALGTGYGQRPFPRRFGPLVRGDHPFAGRPLPAPAAGTDLPDDGWLVLRTRGGPEVIGQGIVDVRPVERDAFPQLVDDDHAVIVRPDRIVAAVTSDPDVELVRLTVGER